MLVVILLGHRRCSLGWGGGQVGGPAPVYFGCFLKIIVVVVVFLKMVVIFKAS